MARKQRQKKAGKTPGSGESPVYDGLPSPISDDPPGLPPIALAGPGLRFRRRGDGPTCRECGADMFVEATRRRKRHPLSRRVIRCWRCANPECARLVAIRGKKSATM